MKNLFFLLPLLAVPCAAQPKVPITQFTISPEAKTVLDEAAATYKAAQSIRLKIVEDEGYGEEEIHHTVSFQKPNLMRVESRDSEGSYRLISDGKASYSTEGDMYERETFPNDSRTLWMHSLENSTAFMLSALLEGRSPLVELQEAYKAIALPPPRVTVIVPPPAVVKGIALHGIKIKSLTPSTRQNQPAVMSEAYVWFDSAGLLRRISTCEIAGKEDSGSVETITEQELNPTFEPDAFKFDTTKLKLIPPPPPPAPPRPKFDPRLKVGTAPFAFSAKDLKGQPISLDKYKGKVVLLDFWATWCGPCVKSLPELKRAYDKYHPKGFEVVGISLDENQTALTSFIKKNNIAWPQIFDGRGKDARVWRLYGVGAIPFLLLIGKDGKIAAVNPRGNIDAAVRVAMAAS